MPSGHEHNQICGFRFMTNLYDETTSLSDGELFKKTFFLRKVNVMCREIRCDLYLDFSFHAKFIKVTELFYDKAVNDY